MAAFRSNLLLSLVWGTCLSISAPAVAWDDDLDDLPSDLLDADSPPEVKVKDDFDDEEDPDFDFGDDPDWDAGPEPVPVPAGLDGDPSQDLPPANDEFFEDDPPPNMADVPPVEDPPAAAPAPAPVAAAAPPVAAAAPPAEPTSGLGISTRGLAPLGDHYEATIVNRDVDALVVELPVLVATQPTDYDGDFWLIVEVLSDDKAVAESRHRITRPSIAEMGATVVWSKSHVPVIDREGTLKIRVSRKSSNGSIKELFMKEVPYTL